MSRTYFTKEDFDFLKVALFSKNHTGALTRSSQYVIKKVLKIISDKPLDQIIEYGPGNGVMTRELLKLLSPKGRLLAVEIDQIFLKTLRAIPDPRLQVIDGTMQDVSQNINTYDFKEVDLIVASIPFLLLSKTERETMASLAEKTLKHGGMFVIFHQYSNIMTQPLKKFFSKVNTHFELRNFLPCFIISAVKSHTKNPIS